MASAFSISNGKSLINVIGMNIGQRNKNASTETKNRAKIVDRKIKKRRKNVDIKTIQNTFLT